MKLVIALLALSFIPAASAQICIASPFSDHAVLQRERPIHLWGTATPESCQLSNYIPPPERLL